MRDPARRLGSGERDADELKQHRFFQTVDWAAYLQLRVPPPWRPSVAGSVDTSQFDQEFTSMQPAGTFLLSSSSSRFIFIPLFYILTPQ